MKGSKTKTKGRPLEVLSQINRTSCIKLNFINTNSVLQWCCGTPRNIMAYMPYTFIVYSNRKQKSVSPQPYSHA